MKPFKPVAVRIITLVSSMITGLGLLVLSGWYLHSATFVQIIPGFAPMQFNTALCFLLSACALLAIARGKQIAVVLSAGFLLAFSTLTLIQYLFGINPGIDELFFNHYIFDRTSHPGRMSPNTAICFMLSGLTFFLAFEAHHSRKIILLQSLLVSIIISLSCVALFGYFNGIEEVHIWKEATRMAIHTAVGFLLVGTGLFLVLSHYTKQSVSYRTFWLPVPAGIAMITITCCLWLVIDIGQRELVEMVSLFGAESPGSVYPGQQDAILSQNYGSLGLTVLFFGLSSTLFLIMTIVFAQKVLRSRDELSRINVNLETSVEKKGRQLQQTELLWGTVFLSVNDIVMIINPDGRILEANNAAEGMKPEDFRDSSIYDYVDEPTEAMVRGNLARAMNTRKSVNYTIDLIDPFGNHLFFSASMTPLVIEDRVEKLVIISRDVTEQRQAEKEIRKLNARLEDRVAERTMALETANKELEAFSYSVSHDLRAPLRHVNGFLDALRLLIADRIDESAARYLNLAMDASDRMGQLIDDLLNFSRMGRQEIKRRVVDLNQLINEVKGELQPEYEHRNIEWSIAELPDISADRSLIKQVLVNLLDNALKYTSKQKKARIEIGPGPDEAVGPATEGWIHFYIRDNGAGFDMAYSNKLFGMFQRLHGEQEFEGTGVGLANVKRIITRHGGSIYAESAPGEGATFFVSLPAQGKGAEHVITEEAHPVS